MAITNKGQYSNCLINEATKILNQANGNGKLSKKQANKLTWISKELVSYNKELADELAKMVFNQRLKSKSFVCVPKRTRANNDLQEEYKRIAKCGFYLDFYGCPVDYAKKEYKPKPKAEKVKKEVKKVLAAKQKATISDLMAVSCTNNKIKQAINTIGI